MLIISIITTIIYILLNNNILSYIAYCFKETLYFIVSLLHVTRIYKLA